ncbi:MAG: DNA polymerase III subunit gamma/tau [Burkholderiaceae bacterium]|nr:DNA polymerase III subunit gamma/tau [Burkholderiaceae bacterium]
MSYQVLARKYRPRDFSTLVGQEHVVRALSNALTENRLHHAYLFTGTRGVGKTTLARILAKALNCVGPDGNGTITATPCNVCDPCTAIDAGRFVDYIEMDAASNRGVDEMVQLLERAMYAPSNARFKVYMIDEVHQLSSHAFNAMLKTLEEPPPYVKFILATTDPQKVPVTVLSRCLQFNLKQMTPSAIADHLAQILGAESLGAEAPALRALAHAAGGSMRDGLSLLDQAIAYAGGDVTLDAVRTMLGAIDRSVLIQVLDAVAARNAAQMLAVADQMNERSVSFAQAMRDLASLLHRIALVQQVASAADDEVDADDLRRLASSIAADEIQLFYQMALHGRNEMHLAPDEYAGFTMTLMRMLAFAPAATQSVSSASAPPIKSTQGLVAAARRAPAGAAVQPGTRDVEAMTLAQAPTQLGLEAAPTAGAPFDGDWMALVARLKVSGLVRELAQRSELVAHEGDRLRLRVPLKTLLDAGALQKLQTAVSDALGRPMRLAADVGSVIGPTSAGNAEKARAEKQRQAEESIYADPFVRELIENFGASVDPGSIRPRTESNGGENSDRESSGSAQNDSDTEKTS